MIDSGDEIHLMADDLFLIRHPGPFDGGARRQGVGGVFFHQA
jgi:hypothetical protein